MPPDRAQPPRLTANRILGPTIFALLLLATVGAFAAAQRLKGQPLILDHVTFRPLVKGKTVITPNGDRHDESARVRFRLTRSDRGRVAIIDRSDHSVRTFVVKVLSKRDRLLDLLPPGSRLPAYKRLAFRWNGRTGSGRLVPTGSYRLRVELLGEHRTLIPAGRIRVHTLRKASKPGGIR